MATDKTTSKYRRATDYVQGLGANLDTIQGKDVLLHSFEIERDRVFGTGVNDLVTMQISTMDDEANLQTFHAWSGPIADRLEELQNKLTEQGESLPVIVAFDKAKTSRGFNVWTII